MKAHRRPREIKNKLADRRMIDGVFDAGRNKARSGMVMVSERT